MSNKTRESHAEKIASAPKSSKGLILSLLILALGVLLFAQSLFSLLNDDTLTINGQRVQVTVVDTPEERAQGLSGRNKLGDKEGMLFKFSSPDYYCIWMKDMKFPIDIIWLDESKKAITIKENATPDSFPRSFCPEAPAKYVLEINAGKAKAWKIDNISRASF